MAVKYKEKCKKCFHFQVCAKVLQNDLFIREVMLGEKEPECKQFVEVVRCKDCKHFKRLCEDSNVFMCLYTSGLNSTNHDNFCSYGERREGE